MRIEKDGYLYEVSIESDPIAPPPWRAEDGHGPVSDWTGTPKKSGERVLHSDRGEHCYYDFEAAVHKARKEGWGPPKFGETKHQTATRTAEEDFQRMRAYCRDEWGYVTLIVTERRTDSDGFEYDGPGESIGGVESDVPEGDKRELVDQLIGEIRARYPKKEETRL